MDYIKSMFNIETESSWGYLIFNTFSKAKAVFDDPTKELYLRGDFKSLSSDTFRDMIRLGFIIDEDFDELAALEEMYIQLRDHPKKLFLTVLPTLACNYNCPYCFEGEKIDTAVIDYETLKKFSAATFPSYKHVHISLFGGEPLLSFSRTADYFDYLSVLSNERSFTYSSGIATNGYLLSKEIVDILIDQCNTENFQITIDGYKASHDTTRRHKNGSNTFDKVITNFKELILSKNSKQKQINIVLRVNLLNNTLEQVYSLLDEFNEEEKKAFEIYFRPIYNTKFYSIKNSNRNELESFYDMAQKHNFMIRFGDIVKFRHCESDGGIDQLSILPNLTVWKCINDLQFTSAQVGRIEKNGELIIDKDLLQKWTMNIPFADEKCKKCKMLPICWGGCPLQYQKSGERICIYEKDFNFAKVFSFS